MNLSGKLIIFGHSHSGLENVTLFTFTAKPWACFNSHNISDFEAVWPFDFIGLLCQSAESQQCHTSPSTEECLGSLWMTAWLFLIWGPWISLFKFDSCYNFLFHVLLEVIWYEVNIANWLSLYWKWCSPLFCGQSSPPSQILMSDVEDLVAMLLFPLCLALCCVFLSVFTLWDHHVLGIYTWDNIFD